MVGRSPGAQARGRERLRERVVCVLAVAWFLATTAYYYYTLQFVDLLKSLLGWGDG